jgi:ABC-2 type transport system ATP-binding protein
MGRDVVRDGPDIRQFVGYMPEHDARRPAARPTLWRTRPCRPAGIAARERTAEVPAMSDSRKTYRLMALFDRHEAAREAGALVHDLSLLLLDEPTNGLIPAGRTRCPISSGGQACNSGSLCWWRRICWARPNGSARSSWQ